MPIASGAGGKPKQFGIKPLPPRQPPPPRSSSSSSNTANAVNRTANPRRNSATGSSIPAVSAPQQALQPSSLEPPPPQPSQQPVRPRPSNATLSRGNSAERMISAPPRVEERRHLMVQSLYGSRPPWATDFDYADEGNEDCDDIDPSSNLRRCRSEMQLPSSAFSPPSASPLAHPDTNTGQILAEPHSDDDLEDNRKTSKPQSNQQHQQQQQLSISKPPQQRFVDTASSPIRFSPVAFEVPVEANRQQQQHQRQSPRQQQSQRSLVSPEMSPPSDHFDWSPQQPQLHYKSAYDQPASPPQIRLVPRRPATIDKSGRLSRLRRQDSVDNDPAASTPLEFSPSRVTAARHVAGVMSRKDSDERQPSRTTTSGYHSAASSPQRSAPPPPLSQAQPRQNRDALKDEEILRPRRSSRSRSAAAVEDALRRLTERADNDDDEADAGIEEQLPFNDEYYQYAPVQQQQQQQQQQQGQLHSRRQQPQMLVRRFVENSTQTSAWLSMARYAPPSPSRSPSPNQVNGYDSSLPASPTGEEVANAILRSLPESEAPKRHHPPPMGHFQLHSQQHQLLAAAPPPSPPPPPPQPQHQQHQQHQQSKPDDSAGFWFAEDSQPRHLTYAYNPTPLDSNPIRTGKVRALAQQFNQQGPTLAQPQSRQTRWSQNPGQQQQNNGNNNNTINNNVNHNLNNSRGNASNLAKAKVLPTESETSTSASRRQLRPAVPNPAPQQQSTQQSQALREASALADSKTFYFGDKSALDHSDLQNRPNLEIIGGPMTAPRSVIGL